MMNDQIENQYEQPSQETAISDKLTDILTPRYEVEFDPVEAELAGAFVEDALSEDDAAESALDHFEPAPEDYQV
jgi:hypothetical protein